MSYDKIMLYSIWLKAKPIAGYDSDVWRHDDFGDVIKRPEYGNRDSEFGWEVDHIVPKAQGGSEHASNLRPLNWKNNVRR